MATKESTSPETRYEALVEDLLSHADVSLGKPGRKGFGSNELMIGGKIFAMLSNGKLVVKLPRLRVDALVESGDGERFDPRRNGRLMKEWLVLNPNSRLDWLSVAREAMEFVASKG